MRLGGERLGLGARLAAIGLATVIAAVPAVTLAATRSALDAAAAFPSDDAWNAYTTADGTPITDSEGEKGLSAANLDIAAAGGKLPSVFVAGDGDDAFFRVRLASDPRDPTLGGFDAATWLIQIATGRDDAVRVVVGVDGRSDTADTV